MTITWANDGGYYASHHKEKTFFTKDEFKKLQNDIQVIKNKLINDGHIIINTELLELSKEDKFAVDVIKQIEKDWCIKFDVFVGFCETIYKSPNKELNFINEIFEDVEYSMYGNVVIK